MHGDAAVRAAASTTHLAVVERGVLHNDATKSRSQLHAAHGVIADVPSKQENTMWHTSGVSTDTTSHKCACV